jgi:hypothetical protein
VADKLRIMVVSSIPPKHNDWFDKAGEPIPQWDDLAALTWATQRKYCDIHGYKFDGNVSDVVLPLGTPWSDQVPVATKSRIRMMVKFQLLLHYLQPEKCGEIFDQVVWMDADCVVTNYDRPLEEFMNSRGYDPENDGDVATGDIILAHNVDGLHPTVIMVRNNARMLGLIWHCSQAGDRMFRQHNWSDIMALRFGLDTQPYAPCLWTHSITALCAQHPDIYGMPKRVAKEYEWNPESLTLHLSALPMSKRIQLAQEYIDRLGLL